MAGQDGKENQGGNTFAPYIEANWLHNTSVWGASLDGVRVSQAGVRNMGEVKTGVKVNLSNSTQLHGHISQQKGSHGFSDTSATLGIRVAF